MAGGPQAHAHQYCVLASHLLIHVTAACATCTPGRQGCGLSMGPWGLSMGLLCTIPGLEFIGDTAHHEGRHLEVMSRGGAVEAGRPAQPRGAAATTPQEPWGQQMSVGYVCTCMLHVMQSSGSHPPCNTRAHCVLRQGWRQGRGSLLWAAGVRAGRAASVAVVQRRQCSRLVACSFLLCMHVHCPLCT